ncbi:MAG: HAD family hydrolase [Rhodanobacter sp.]|nr:MAG: HAD family hydrolase [Rhodanobacter sp.]
MTKGIIALDADGVLLDYNLAYASAWEHAFGVYPLERDPHAYWAIDRWQVERLAASRLKRFRICFDELFWSGIPAIEGAAQACHVLQAAGYDLVCVTAVPARFRQARQQNLLLHGFPIERVCATDTLDSGRSPKADVLNALGPVAFVDDYMPYLVGIDPAVHSALIMRGRNGSPNCGAQLRLADSQHSSLLEFSRWWVAADK